MLYLYTRRDMPDPGAQAFALASYGMPALDLVGGGRFYYGELSIGTAPSSQIQAGSVMGLGGVMTGGIVGMPLTDLQASGVSSQAYMTGAVGYD